MNGYYDENGNWVSLDVVKDETDSTQEDLTPGRTGVGDRYLDWTDEEKGVGSGRSYASVGVDASTLPDPTKFDINKVGDWFGKLLTGKGSVADYGTVLTGLMGLYEYMNRDRSPKSWEGKVQKGTYVPPTISPEYTKNVVSRGYGKPAMGMNPFTGGRYIAPPAAAPTPAAQTPAAQTPDKSSAGQPYPNITDASVREFLNSPAYQEYQRNAPSFGTMDTYNSRYFGLIDSGSKGRGLDSAYETWYQQKYGANPYGTLPYAEDFVAPAPVAPAPVAAAPTSSSAGAGGGGGGGGGGGYPYISEMYFAKGGALPPRYLRGETDGMADKLPSSIDGQQPAKLSHGEFVIPADVVSHLGNGNSDAGAKVLYKMMDRVRQARTGTKRQGKQIKPEKFMPGGIANIPRYAGGGAVAFNNGGTATAGTTAGGLAPWVGDYVAGPEGFLSKAWALGDQPYQAYQGPLTAGVSPLQEQAFTMAQNLGTPSQFGTATQMATQAGQAAGAASFTPGTFNTGLGPVGSVQSYMSPYMQSVVDIQAREARRQADIGRQAEQARLAQAGAYGGSRQAIMEAERQRNLGQQIGDIQEKGLQSAYDRAMEQRFKEAGLGMDAQRAGEQSRQFGANLGLQGIGQQIAAAGQLGSLGTQQFGTQLQGLDALSRAGATQQQAEQASVDAQLRQFQEAQQWPYKQLEFQRGLLSGLPVGTQTVTPTTSGFSDLIGGIGDLLGLYKDVKALG